MARILSLLIVLAMACVSPLRAQATITTVAGGGPDNVPALSAPLWPQWLTTDPAGNLYFTSRSDYRIFKVDPNGLLTSFAGTGIEASSGDGLTAERASFLFPTGLDLDAAGNLFVYEAGELGQFDEPCPRYYRSSFSIRRIDAISRTVSRLAFIGSPGARVAGQPLDLQFDALGKLHLSLTVSSCPTYGPGAGVVTRIDPATGQLTHEAGLASEAGGPLADGSPATDVSILGGSSVAFDASGDTLLSDPEHFRIRRVGMGDGLISTYAGNGLNGCEGDGGSALSASLSAGPIESDAAGNLFLQDDCARIRRIDAATGIIQHYAGNGTWGYGGDDGPAMDASFTYGGLHADAAGNLYLLGGGRIRKVDAATRLITTVAGTGAVYGSGAFLGDGGPPTQARIRWPVDVALAPNGDLFLADAGRNRIRRVDGATGTISTVLLQGNVGSGRFPSLSGVAVSPAGELFAVYYTTSSAIGPLGDSTVIRIDPATGSYASVAGMWYPGFSGDGGPASASVLNDPRDIAFDAAGNLFIADTENHRIRRVDAATGVITTFAGGGPGPSGDGGPASQATLVLPTGVAVGPFGDLYIADSGQFRIRRVDAISGAISTVAGTGVPGDSGDGGPAAQATLTPDRLATDRSGNLYISTGARVRKIDAGTGLISTVAGNGVPDFSGDGGPASQASLSGPRGIALDDSGGLYIADYWAGRIRRVGSGTAGTNAPPLAAASATADCAGGGSSLILDGTASADPDSSPGTNDDIVLYEWFEDYGAPNPVLLGTGRVLAVTLPRGPHAITLRVTDRAAATDVDRVAVAEDLTPPEITVSVNTPILRPANHQMVAIRAEVSAVDSCGSADIVLESVVSSDPDDAPGASDGNTTGDIQGADLGTADFDFQLRAELDRQGAGRTYTIIYSATDIDGNVATASAVITVPRDRPRRP